MKRILFLYLLLALACQEENEITQRAVENGCYLSEVTASNLGTYRYYMKDGKLTKITYDGQESDAVYVYDNENKLIRLESATFRTEYIYNDKDQMILSKNISYGTLVSTFAFEYDASGYPKYSLSTTSIEGQVQYFSETYIEYLNGNPVKYTTYLYNSTSTDKGNPMINTITYDDKMNPYNTLNSTTGLGMKNNPVEFNYVNSPEDKTVITYTYNEDGYPITYNQHYPNRKDNYPDVSGTYVYDCSGG